MYQEEEEQSERARLIETTQDHVDAPVLIGSSNVDMVTHTISAK